MRKYAWVPGRRLARRSAVTNLLVQLMIKDRLTERHFRHPVELERVVHLEPVPARKCDHLRQDGVRETGGHRVPAHHLLEKVFAEALVGAGGLLAGDDDLRNTWLTQFDQKKPGLREFSRSTLANT